MTVTVNDAIADIAADAWNRLVGNDNPIVRHEFLLAAEQSGAVSPQTGWTPRHLTLSHNGELIGAIPLYEKSHSWGEFVFDWSWAHAYDRAGLHYYPKLVSAVPFTPASSPRLLLRDRNDHKTAAALLEAAISLAIDTDCSSLHVLFPAAGDLPFLRTAGLRLRKDCQFHWHNHNYDSFDEFLRTFSAKKRKKVRQDRRWVMQAGIVFRRLRGHDLEPDIWRTVYRLISITFMRRGSLPYFGLEFFTTIGATMPDNIMVILAEYRNEPIAAAIFFESDRVLYGRYWGSDGQYDALHFETCYYQGIEYCIEFGKKTFEPGTQGEHKISRGFVPVETWSAHWLRQPEFFSAIGDYLDEEGRHIDRYMDAVSDHSPYRDDTGRNQR